MKKSRFLSQFSGSVVFDLLQLKAYSGLLSSFEQLSREQEETEAKWKFAQAREQDYALQIANLRSQMESLRAAKNNCVPTAAGHGEICLIVNDNG